MTDRLSKSLTPEPLSSHNYHQAKVGELKTLEDSVTKLPAAATPIRHHKTKKKPAAKKATHRKQRSSLVAVKARLFNHHQAKKTLARANENAAKAREMKSRQKKKERRAKAKRKGLAMPNLISHMMTGMDDERALRREFSKFSRIYKQHDHSNKRGNMHNKKVRKPANKYLKITKRKVVRKVAPRKSAGDSTLGTIPHFNPRHMPEGLDHEKSMLKDFHKFAQDLR